MRLRCKWRKEATVIEVASVGGQPLPTPTQVHASRLVTHPRSNAAGDPGHRVGRMQDPSAVTGLDLVTLAVAIVGAVSGVVALALQGLFFRNSGPRVVAGLRYAWINPAGAAITLPIGAQITGPPQQGFTTLMLAVEARNKGRAATTVEKVSIDLPGGVAFQHTSPPVGPGVPYRLDAESSETWYLDPAGILSAAEVFKVPALVGGAITLGSGRVIRTDRSRLG